MFSAACLSFTDGSYFIHASAVALKPKEYLANLFQCQSLAFIFVCCVKKPKPTPKIPHKTKLQTKKPQNLD